MEITHKKRTSFKMLVVRSNMVIVSNLWVTRNLQRKQYLSKQVGSMIYTLEKDAATFKRFVVYFDLYEPSLHF